MAIFDFITTGSVWKLPSHLSHIPRICVSQLRVICKANAPGYAYVILFNTHFPLQHGFSWCQGCGAAGVSPRPTDKHLHVTLTPAHNLHLPIRRLITVLSLGCGRNLHTEYLPWDSDTGESISLYIQRSISQSCHCGDPRNKTSSLFFSIFQLLSPS